MCARATREHTVRVRVRVDARMRVRAVMGYGMDGEREGARWLPRRGLAPHAGLLFGAAVCEP